MPRKEAGYYHLLKMMLALTLKPLPEITSEILSLYERYDATHGIKEMAQYIFRPTTEGWYVAEVKINEQE